MEKTTKEEKQLAIDLMEKRNTTEYNWVRTVITAISTILGLVIALKSNNSGTRTEHILFVVAIVSSGLCVLVGLLFLHRETDTYHGLFLRYNKHISVTSANRSGKLLQFAPKRIYEVLKALFFVLLFSSIISLLIYSVYSDNVKESKEDSKEKFETKWFQKE
jgi:hypothetical protein